MITSLAATTLASFKLVRRASYSASLFIAKNCSLTAYFTIPFSGDMRTTPAPLAFLVEDPSVWIVYVFLGEFSLTYAWVNSAMKSVRTWALITTRGLYSMSNWPNSSSLLLADLLWQWLEELENKGEVFSKQLPMRKQSSLVLYTWLQLLEKPN